MTPDVTPRKARRDFLRSKRGSIKESSLRAYEYPTESFVSYLEENGIDSMQDVDGYIIERWKLARKTEGIKLITLHNNVKHLRVFLGWCESTELAPSGIYDKVQVPNVPDEQEASNDVLGPDRANRLLQYCEQYEYATRLHAVFQLLWHTGCRISALVGLDVDDFDQLDDFIQFRNRKETGTPLKNGDGGERNVSLNQQTRDVLTDYIEARRTPQTDEYGREPLFTNQNGRMARQNAYKDFTALTRPCEVSNDCPHNREIPECEAASRKSKAFGCPSTTTLHAIRRGSITYHLNHGWPVEAVSERCDVSRKVLEKHYDVRTAEDKRHGRREHMDML
jgi:site-specific recombinase XerD